MPDRHAALSLARGTAITAALLLTGCTSTGNLFGRNTAPAPATPATGSPTAASAEGPVTDFVFSYYFDNLQPLVQGDELDRAATFNQIRTTAELEPNTSNQLLHALAMALPGHPGSDPVAAADRLAELIAATETLLPEERILAEIQLESANEIRILLEANENAEQALTNASAARDEEHEATVSRLRDENTRLTAELENARFILDAMTDIEQTLSEREDTDE